MSTSWWALSEDVLAEMLSRAHAGESPDLLLLELTANSDVQEIDGDQP